MNDTLRRILENLVPFILLGIALALFVGLFIMFSYVVVWGLFIGVILWGVSLIRDFFSPQKQKSASQGRVIEHKDQD